MAWDVVEISNGRLRARLAPDGARLLQLWVPDRDGVLDDVVLGFDTEAAYRANHGLYVGCTVGRVANRIRGARFELDGETYRLTANEPPNHLHGGGARSFGNRRWAALAEPDRVTFSLVGDHLEEGYPGAVRAHVTYRLTDRDELVIDYLAEPDRPTPLALTHHSYWNLGGHRDLQPVLDHELWVAAARYTPVDDELLPTGEVAWVSGSALDFRTPTPLGARIEPLRGTATHGYDHNLVLGEGSGWPDQARPDEPRLVASLRHPRSGRRLELSTTEPALQVYAGGALPIIDGKGGARYGPFAGVALEPQGYPNAVNEPRFPSIVVSPEAPYRQRSIYRFVAE